MCAVCAGAGVGHQLVMDRWSGREDDDDNVKAGPQGRVARLGIGAFVKQDAGAIDSAQNCLICYLRFGPSPSGLSDLQI